MRSLYFFYVSAIMLLSCNSSKETVKSATPLYNTRWSLKKIYTGDAIQTVETKAFIRFDKEKGSAGGNGSCNSFGSNFSLNNDAVNFKNIFSTKMYCEQVQQTENKFLGNLEKVNRFEIKKDGLFLYRDRELLLEFISSDQIKSTE